MLALDKHASHISLPAIDFCRNVNSICRPYRLTVAIKPSPLRDISLKLSKLSLPVNMEG
jgi:hypothetical protein